MIKQTTFATIDLRVLNNGTMDEGLVDLDATIKTKEDTNYKELESLFKQYLGDIKIKRLEL